MSATAHGEAAENVQCQRSIRKRRILLDFLNGDAFCLGVENKLIIFKNLKAGQGIA